MKDDGAPDTCPICKGTGSVPGGTQYRVMG